MDYSNQFVCLMGLGTVLFGLVCIIALTYLMSRMCGKSAQTVAVTPIGGTMYAAPEPSRQEMIAAVSAALAEELGTDLSGIRILSFQKI